MRKQDRDENIHRGRQMLDKEIKRLAIADSYESLAKLFGYEKVDDFLAAIGYGDINSQHLAQRVLDKERKELEKDRLTRLGRNGGADVRRRPARRRRRFSRTGRGGLAHAPGSVL